MKKKIKDLTLIEARNYCGSRHCKNCPLLFDEKNCLLYFLAINSPIDEFMEETLEREVEINESNND